MIIFIRKYMPGMISEPYTFRKYIVTRLLRRHKWANAPDAFCFKFQVSSCNFSVVYCGTDDLGCP